MVLPPRLEQALAAASVPVVPNVGGHVQLPNPRMAVDGLPGHIGFPLPLDQAEELMALSSHNLRSEHKSPRRAGTNCLSFSPLMLTITNPAWKPALDSLVKKCAVKLGLKPWSVYSALNAFQVYSVGSQFPVNSVRDGDLTSYGVPRRPELVFGSLIIQLPSSVDGGELLVLGKEDGALCHDEGNGGAFGLVSFYTAFFSDAHHKVRSLTKGFRIALAYDLVWRGTGPKPGLVVEGIDRVRDALRKHANKSPLDAWTLAFPLNQKYPQHSLRQHGVRALVHEDKKNAAVLSCAANLEGMGELEIILARVKRKDIETGVVHNDAQELEVTDRLQTSTQAEEVYASDGSYFEKDVSFLNWTDATKGVELFLESVGDILPYDESVGYSEGTEVSRAAMYRTTVIAMWPKNKGFEILSNNDANFMDVIDDGPALFRPARVHRILKWYETSGAPVITLVQAKLLLQLCVEWALPEHASRVIRLVPLQSEPRLCIHNIILECVIEFGWQCLAKGLHAFLCPPRINGLKDFEDRLKTLHELQYLIPLGMCINALATVVDFLAQNNHLTVVKARSIASSERECRAQEERLRSLWGILATCFTHTHKRAGDDIGAKKLLEGLLSRLCCLLHSFHLLELRQVCKVLSDRNPRDGAHVLETVQRAATAILYDRLRSKFLSDTRYILKNRHAPVQQQQNCSTWKQQDDSAGWGAFLALAHEVLSVNEVPAEAIKHYRKFLQKIPELSARDLQALQEVVLRMEKETQCLFPRIHNMILRSMDLARAKKLREDIRVLSSKTRQEPQNPRVVYQGAKTGVHEVDSFLHSEKMETYIRGTGSTEAARTLLTSIEGKLPKGVQACVGGIGRRSYIYLAKARAADRAKYLRYVADKKKVVEAMEEIMQIIARKRSLADIGLSPPLAKRAKKDVSPTKVILDLDAQSCAKPD